jgi:hypothetical protein
MGSKFCSTLIEPVSGGAGSDPSGMGQRIVEASAVHECRSRLPAAKTCVDPIPRRVVTAYYSAAPGKKGCDRIG